MAGKIPTRTFTSHIRAASFIPLKGGGFGMKIINKTGSSIAANKIVALTGFDVTSGFPKVVLADATAAGHDDLYITKFAIANGAKGYVLKGFLSTRDLNTNVGTVGDPVFVDPATAGGFTITAPGTGSVNSTPVGFTTVKSATVGQIFWNVGPRVSNVQTASGTITSANITGTSAGQLGHANGVILVPAAATGFVNQLVSTVLINSFSVAAYTGGGNTTINIGGGGAALTGLVSNANFIQAAANKVIEFVPLAATFNTYTTANSLNLVTASAPTQPGTAAGVFKYVVHYRVILGT